PGADRDARATPGRPRARARCGAALGRTRARESHPRRAAARDRAPARPLHAHAHAAARATVPAGRARTARAQTHAHPAGTERADRRGGPAVAEVVTDPRELVRVRVERALAAEEVNLASEQGRARAQTLIEEVLRSYEADALNGQERELAADEREQLARELRHDLIGLGAIAERMLADPFAHECTINGPKRVFRDTGERIERVPDLTFHDDRQVRSFLERP